jgi:uridylate kinase
MGAQLLVLLTDVEGVYNMSPSNPEAKLIHTYTTSTAVEVRGHLCCVVLHKVIQLVCCILLYSECLTANRCSRLKLCADSYCYCLVCTCDTVE